MIGNMQLLLEIYSYDKEYAVMIRNIFHCLTLYGPDFLFRRFSGHSLR